MDSEGKEKAHPVRDGLSGRSGQRGDQFRHFGFDSRGDHRVDRTVDRAGLDVLVLDLAIGANGFAGRIGLDAFRRREVDELAAVLRFEETGFPERTDACHDEVEAGDDVAFADELGVFDGEIHG